jgi:hypothetical protein
VLADSSVFGGDSFVQLWTGLNLAFVAWDRYQDALSWPRDKCEQIIESTTCNILDKEQKGIVAVFVRWSKTPIKILRYACFICRWSAALGFGIGVYLLYAHKLGAWDGLLILPTVLYFGLSSICLGIFWVITASVGRLVPSITQQIATEIKETGASTQEDQDD